MDVNTFVDKLFEDPEFIEIMKSIRDTKYNDENCIVSLDRSVIFDLDSTEDLLFFITKFISYMDKNILETEFIKILKQYFFSLTILVYFWDQIYTTYPPKYKFVGKYVDKTISDDVIIINFNVNPSSYIKSSMYIKSTDLGESASKLEVAVEVDKNNLIDMNYLNSIILYLHNIDKGRAISSRVNINELTKDYLEEKIKYCS